MRLFEKVFVYTNLFTALGAVLAAMLTDAAFRLQQPIYYWLFLFNATLCSYSMHWYFTPPDSFDERGLWSIANRRILLTLGISSLVVGIYSLLQLPIKYTWFSLPLVLFSFMYTAPKIPYAPFIQLRKFVVAKTSYLSLAWLYATVIMPVLIINQGQQPGFVNFIIHRFAIIYAVCLLFDFKDGELDFNSGIKTILHLVKTPLLRTIIALLLSIGIVSNAHLLGSIPNWVWGFNFVPLLLLMICFKPALNTKSDFFYYVILDGIMYVAGLVFFVLKMV